MGGGRGGGRSTNSAAAILDEPTGSASAFGGGGGAGSYNNNSFVNYGGGSSVYGGGGGGAGGYSTTGGFASNITPAQGGGPVPVSRGANYGAAGGGGISQQGLTTQYAVDPFQGGGGGVPAISLTTYASGTLFCANNGAQTVLLGAGSGNGFAFPWGLLFVSSNGLANYTVYSTGRSSGNTGIVHDGTKYVLATLQQNNTRKYFSSIYSTTDFVTFTDHPVPSAFRTQELRTTNDNGFKYINGLYFLCMSTDLYYSSDLVTWTRANVAGGTNVIINSVAYDGTKYYALQSTGTVYFSTNLTSWTSSASGVGSGNSIAASPSVVVATGNTQSKYSTDGGVNWVNLPTISAAQGRIVRYISSTATWLITTAVSLDIYYSSNPTVSWTLATDSASATGYRDIAYNGTQYIATGGYGGTADVVSTTSNLASAFTLQAASSFTAPALKGCNGGIAGGGGGGAASSTTTSNGGAGGDGYCRVYTW